MKNIFSQTKDYVKQPKRNAFDLSFHNHGTFNFGYLYPVFCKETIPGDSFKIDPTFALRFLPTAFPVQTRVTANLHFFYVRNRNLWKNWKKFITHTDDVQFPYLDGSQDSITTSGLADYLGVPTTLVGGFARTELQTFRSFMHYSESGNIYNSYDFDPSNIVDTDLLGRNLDEVLLDNQYSTDPYNLFQKGSTPISQFPRFPYSIVCSAYTNNGASRNKELTFLISRVVNGENVPFCLFNIDGLATPYVSGEFATVTYSFNSNTSFYFSDAPTLEKNFSTELELYKFISENYPSDDYRLNFMTRFSNFDEGILNTSQAYPNPVTPNNVKRWESISYVLSSQDNYSDYSDLNVTDRPFLASNDNSVHLSALPFRAYESIYNSFYRNDQNDPLMIDGKPEYDVYVPNQDDGSDDYNYKLYRRNWELDFLTSAVQSPQQGIAPLVGVSQQGDFTFVNKDSNGNVGYFTAKANISSNGNTITGFQLSDKVELQGLPTNPVSGADVPDEIKRGTVYTLNQMALAGISINDFRNVNSLQRWLETNIRRGYKYRDQIKSHYGVDISEKILDMPEFIGGISSPVFSSQVNQTVETESDPLGSYAGQLSLITDSKHSIKHYCDEHGFIIGILSIVPVPNYSQLLPKHFLKYNYLDYYFPEFAHIGMQPIDYREVCPVQQFGVDSNGLNDTFGYQRPWYDYISSVDEVHGLFRTNLRNFVLNRQFDSRPMLNADFLQVDPEQLNDIFTVQDVEDKILGQIKFNVIAKRPIPKFGIPRLE